MTMNVLHKVYYIVVSYSGNVKRSVTFVTEFLLSLEYVYFWTSCIAGNVGLSNLVYLCCHFELHSYIVIYGYWVISII